VYSEPEVDAGAVLRIPILGEVAAGAPLSAAGSGESVRWPVAALPIGAKARELFALRINGDSMTAAGIPHGALTFVRRWPHDARGLRGRVVVAAVHGEATCKRLLFDEAAGEVLLYGEGPADDEWMPIFARGEDVELIGEVVGVWVAGWAER